MIDVKFGLGWVGWLDDTGTRQDEVESEGERLCTSLHQGQLSELRLLVGQFGVASGSKTEDEGCRFGAISLGIGRHLLNLLIFL